MRSYVKFYRVGEEREGAVRTLDDERRIYEEQLKLIQMEQERVTTEKSGMYSVCFYVNYGIPLIGSTHLSFFVRTMFLKLFLSTKT